MKSSKVICREPQITLKFGDYSTGCGELWIIYKPRMVAEGGDTNSYVKTYLYFTFYLGITLESGFGVGEMDRETI